MTQPATPNSMPATGQPPAAAAPQQPAQQQPAQQQPAAPAAAPAAPEAPAGGAQPGEQQPAGGSGQATPPWGSDEDFDPAKAWSLIQNLRGDKEQLQNRLADVQPLIDQAEQARRDEQGELATLREDLIAAATREAAWRTKALTADARALADGRFIDADAALALVGDVSSFVDGDGLDTAKMAAAFDALAEKKPHLVKPATPPGFKPNRAQGQSGTGGVTPSQIAAQAEQQQDWKKAAAAKSQQLIELRQQQS
ncbi:scaffolding protein [Mycobacterium phage Nairb]|uniref:Scaffolding protein n=5 Tax=Bernalvirus bernal13 TaxID=1982102 RepID=A0A2P1JRM4_9CAUD|nr:head scaffolding protein [Mycobacterium phage Bernal13]AIT13420.1 hypothetical protein PBI_RONRAYGUN_7 [Mycobacterium phage RonRayGun]ASJ79088.1 hypothetical protein SEA_ZENTIME222_7 [Mycobacterium phage ZenTime222]AVO21795.1 scaffolding protein [Mycobacterium phage Nairb]QBP28852.1 scaffolding protein [Mycobacterium phage Ibrahim]QHB47413.1 scaffolding protein [Mycobacterium phage Whitty]